MHPSVSGMGMGDTAAGLVLLMLWMHPPPHPHSTYPLRIVGPAALESGMKGSILSCFFGGAGYFLPSAALKLVLEVLGVVLFLVLSYCFSV